MARNGQVGDFELSYEKNELEQPHELQNGYELTYELPNQDEPDEDADRDPCDVMALPVCRSGRKGHKFRSCFKSAMDGFEGSDLEAVFNQIRKFARKGRGLTNIFSFGGFDELESKRFHDRKHRFHRINPDSGRVVGAIAGNFLFRFGGRHNRLSDTGKIVLDNMMSGKYRRKMHRFEPVVKPEDKEKLQKVKPPRPPPPTPIAVPDLSDFERQRKRCLAEKSLFEDPDFPANNKSLFNSRPTRNIIWKRPGEIVPDPQLIVGDKSRFDVKQGLLGNCWLLAAIANLTLHDELFYRVVPPDQSFTDNYAGIFHFYFWRYGKWVEVVVDDRLPTIDGKLCYMKSQENNEFWSALLEKAYAKMYGCYENLEGGTTAEALEDFTGGLTEFFDLRKVAKTTVLSQMVRGMQMGSLFACSIDADANIKELQLSNGLICGHAYSLTSLHTVKNLKGKQVPLLRLRNPWGNSREWRGAWSDGSSEWRTIDEQTKEDLGIEFAQDGEFWMTFDDFYRNFTQMEVCNLSAAVMDEIAEMTGVDVKASQTYVWKETSTDGEWSTAKGTAGGCTNNPHSFYNNPQYATYFTVPDTSLEKDGKCTVIVAVMQKYRRELKSLGKDSLPIGFAVYACDGVKYTMHPRFFVQTTPVCRSGAFINVRQVTARFRVPPGDYVTVPSTYDPNCDAEFLLRIYSNTRLMTKLLEKDPDY